LRSAADDAALIDYYLRTRASDGVRAQARQRKLLARERDTLLSLVPATLIMQTPQTPRETFVLMRGQYDLHSDRVACDVPAILPPIEGEGARDRTAIAAWLFRRDHPLTARVIANRYWQLMFGRGLVRTPDDFGMQGDPPTHPELLDWLAAELMDSGWNIKHLVRLIATSATYRQSSFAPAELLGSDPDNRLLARGPRSRLLAEAIRDQALYVSGLLVEKLGGPPAFPYEPAGLWEALNSGNGWVVHYRQDAGESLYRRSIYTYWKRTLPPPDLALFDAPARDLSVVSRQETNTPLQALVLLDDPQMVEAARHLAERMIKEGGADPSARIAWGFRLTTLRAPAPDEVALLVQAYDDQLAEYAVDRSAAERVLEIGDSSRDPNLSLTEHAAMTIVARVLLNLGETITKE
jgi:hypothetical protein